MSDLISRQDAIDALGGCPVGDTSWDFGCRNQWEWDTKILRTLPSAEPKRKKGKWQRRKDSDCWECSQCHAVLENDDLGMHNFYFCYHCGADMMNKSGYMNIEEVHYG